MPAFTRIELSRSALEHNVSEFRRVCRPSAFMAVVKSNAYGHGLPEVVGALSGKVDWFGVNSVPEAMGVREYDPGTAILVMGESTESQLRAVQAINLAMLRQYERYSERMPISVFAGPGRTDNLETAPPARPEERDLGRVPLISVVVSRLETVRYIIEECPEVPFHLKVDTGMSRLGLGPLRIGPVLGFLRDHPEARWTGLMTHFANVEDVTDQSYASRQLEVFDTVRERAFRAAGPDRSLLFHAAASAPALIMPEARLDIVRVGISLYGLWPSSETRLSANSFYQERGERMPTLEPVLRWVTKIAHLNPIPAGQDVGYGCTHRVQVDTLVAVLPVGYFEGYDRGLSNRSHVLIRGKQARVLGRVCMNMIMVDVTHIDGVSVGDEAVLIGADAERPRERVTAEELADLTGTINYEVTTRIQKDLRRVVVE